MSKRSKVYFISIPAFTFVKATGKRDAQRKALALADQAGFHSGLMAEVHAWEEYSEDNLYAGPHTVPESP